MKKVLFLFGAGASAFSGPCNPGNPPLGKDLYSRMVAEGFVSPDLPPDVRVQFESEPRFEIAMQALLSHESLVRAPFMRGMARYFSRFTPVAGNHYTSLIDRLRDVGPFELYLASLNYETILEHALVSRGYPPECVIKPHGSCSFLLDTNAGNSTFRNISIADVPAEGRQEISFNSLFTIDATAIQEWCDHPNNGSFYPAMSYYAEYKATTMNAYIVNKQRDDWRDSLSKCDICFIIGVACNQRDPHIWNELRDASCALVYVNPSDDGFGDWLAVTTRKNARRWELTFEAAIPRIINCLFKLAQEPLSVHRSSRGLLDR